MQPISHIRKSVFRCSQAELASLAGVSQATVSRWESGELNPNLDEMARIRAAALSASKDWDDRWFFELPASPTKGAA